MRQFLPCFLALLVAISAPSQASQKRVLFDNAHAETAGNADWQIDTDQPFPLPPQQNITPATARTYWLGAISSWGVDLVKRGYYVLTNPATHPLSYGNTSDTLDLSHFDVLIVDEPNTRFSSAESLAIFSFVSNGGGLVAVSDHDISDRNNDKFDSPRIWDRLDSQHFFGVHFDTTGEANNNFSQNSGNVETSPTDTVTHGPYGVADSVSFHNGTSMQLYPGTNASVRGDLWMNGAAHGTTQVMAAHATYGNGRIFFVGDSSPCDDGSATPLNYSIFDGWGEASGRDSLLFLNATYWVTRRDPPVDGTPPLVSVTAPNGGEIFALGASTSITWTATDNVGVSAVDVDYTVDGGAHWVNLATGIANTSSLPWTLPASPTNLARARVTARDGAGNSAQDESDANFTIADQTPPTASVLSPNGGESWLEGSVHNITWSATDNVGVDSVALEFSLHGAPGPWIRISGGLSNSGSFSWAIPVGASDSAMVRVTAFDAALLSSVDLSDSLFQIVAPVVATPPSLPVKFFVSRPTPNPSRSGVRVRFGLPAAGEARIQVVDISGRRILERTDVMSAGVHEFSWDGKSSGGRALPAGRYFVRISSPSGSRSVAILRLP